MSNKQETLIYIEKEEATEAHFMSRTFINKEIKNRAYINTLGAELVIKFLNSEGVTIENLHNIHSVSKVLECTDIADIILPNIHIDVRTVFDKQQIFIPKSHFELGITPDIYVVLILDQDFKYCELAGFFTPDMINKKDANTLYYFISPDKLYSPETLSKYINNFTGKFSKELSQDEILRGRELSVMLADHNISATDTKELLNLLIASSVLRESVIEYDNFETLAHNTVLETDLTTLTPEFNIQEDILTDTTSNYDFEVSSELDFDSDTDSDNDSEDEKNNNKEIFETDFNTEQEETSAIDSDDITIATEEEALTLDDTFINDLTLAIEENNEKDLEQKNEENNTFEEDNIITIESDEPHTLQDHDTSIEIENLELNIEELPIEPIEQFEDLTMDLDEIVSESPIEEDKEKKTDFDIQQTITESIKTIGETALAAGAIAAGAEIAASASAADEVIKLAGVSGDVLENLLDKNVENQQENLNKIDYTNIQVNADEIPEEISAIISPKVDTSASEEYDAPTDLSELKTIDANLNKEEVFEHETINLNEMETIESEEFIEATDDIVNLNNINVDSPTKPAENLTELINHPEEEGIDLPDVSTFTLDDIDNNEFLNIDQMNSEEEHLTDMPLKDLQDSDDIEISYVDAEEIQLEDLTVNIDDNFSLPSNNETTNEEKFNENVSTEFISESEPELELEFDKSLEIDKEIKDEQSTIQEAQQDISLIEEIETTQNFEEVNIDDFSDLDEFTTEETTENYQEESLENFSEITNDEIIESISDDEISDIQSDEISEPELDEEFSTDLNTEINADETLHDSEPIKELETEGIIDNPEEQPQTAIENSTVISDKTFVVGEIPIDINIINKPQFDNNEPLGSIYNQDSEIDSGMLQTPGRTGKNKTGGKTGLGILGGLITLIIVCAIGFGLAKIFKAPNEETPQPTTDDALPTDTVDTQTTTPDTLNVNTDDVVKMDNNTNALINTSTTTPTKVTTTKTSNELKQQTTPAQTGKQSTSTTTFLEVRKLTWEIPDYVAYNPQFKQYFQAAGKSLKLSLTTDLLLAKEFSYSNEIKVTTTFNKDGTFKEARILKSSGSSQIDRIVLQTVNQTLKVLKAPASVGNDENTTAILKIYF